MELRWLETITDREVTRVLQYTNVNGEWHDVPEYVVDNQSGGEDGSD